MKRSGLFALLMAAAGALLVLLRHPPEPVAPPAPRPIPRPAPPRTPVPGPGPAPVRPPVSKPTPVEPPRRARALLSTAAWLPVVAVGGLLAGLVAAALVPFAFGARPMTVMSGSMDPAIATGDVVVVKQVSPTSLKPGEVATFRDPKHRRLISHRVRGMTRTGGRVAFVTRGDANNTSERWTVGTRGHVGRVVYRIPKAGYVGRVAKSPEGRLGLVIVPALLLGAWALAAIWRAPPALPHEPEPAEAMA